MTVAVITPEIVTLDEAQDYLRDKGIRDGNADNLQRLINAVHGDTYEITSRKRLLDTGVAITEYLEGDAEASIFTDEYPITEVTTVTRWPHDSALLDAITGPGTALSNANMVVDQPRGEIHLKDKNFPSGAQTVSVVYKAGYASTSSEIAAIKIVMLEALQARWQRFIEKPGIIQTRESDDHRWTFKSEKQIRDAMIAALYPWRRLH